MSRGEISYILYTTTLLLNLTELTGSKTGYSELFTSSPPSVKVVPSQRPQIRQKKSER